MNTTKQKQKMNISVNDSVTCTLKQMAFVQKYKYLIHVGLIFMQ